MSYRWKKSESHKLTSELHDKFREYKDVGSERKLKPKRLKWLRGLLKNGDFNACEWDICYCKETKTWYRVNGNHSKTVLQEIRDGKLEGVRFPEGIPVQLRHWEADLLVDLSDIFDRFDNPNSSRSPDDKLGEYQSHFADMRGLPEKFVSKILAGVIQAVKDDPDVKARIPEDLIQGGAFYRGKLLNEEKVRDFVLVIRRYRSLGTFQAWQEKTGVIAAFFSQFLKIGEEFPDLFDVEMRVTAFEFGKKASEFARGIRKRLVAKGMSAGEYYNETMHYLLKLDNEMSKMDLEEMKERLDRMEGQTSPQMAEEDEQEEVPVA